MVKIFHKFKKLNYFQSTILIALIVLWAIMFISNVHFRNVDNLASILREASFLGITAIGGTLVIICGQIDLSTAGLLAALSVLTITLLRTGINLFWTIIFVLIVGIIGGTLNGIFIGKLRMPSFIVTLATLLIYRSIVNIYLDGGSIQFCENWFTVLGNGNLLGIPIPLIIFAVLVILSNIILKNTPIGRRIMAVGNSPEASKISGVNPNNIIIIVFAVAGFFVAISSILVSSRLWMATGSMKEGYEFDVITAVVLGGTPLIGGKGNIFNTAIAAIFIASLTNAMNLFFIDPFWQYIIKGIVLLLAFSLNSVKEIIGELLKKYRIHKIQKINS